ncbi:MAG: HEPN domain-containing protein [Methanosarcina mazei]|uniref:HEPN domain-containing protein n=1 Tax=Methanosarcina soligelidi TaxID=1036677 RepID=UPI00064F0C20|nr:HEPN domain-containing protein [Methanosarcina soligelidi]
MFKTILNRDTLHDLAEIRLDEAKILLDNEKYDGAYYLSGYVIELALKACIAKQVKQYDFPDKDAVSESYTHKLKDLLKATGLAQKFNTAIEKNRQLGENWAIAVNWSEEKRYTKNDKQTAEAMFDAITDKNNGVFTWIKQHW